MSLEGNNNGVMNSNQFERNGGGDQDAGSGDDIEWKKVNMMRAIVEAQDPQAKVHHPSLLFSFSFFNFFPVNKTPYFLKYTVPFFQP